MLAAYRGGERSLEAIARGAGAFVARPPPTTSRCWRSTRWPRASPAAAGRSSRAGSGAIPATASALVDAFGDRAALFLGGGKRSRYRLWLEIARGPYDVVIGTRPAVFAPVDGLGLIYVARESHPAHREDRAPYYHARDVALARTRLEGAVCVLAAACPSAEASALRLPAVEPAARRWPPVEVVRPGPPDARRGSSRLWRPLVAGSSSHRSGYGVAQVCRSCGEPAACASCGGLLRAAEGAVTCVVCGASGRCRSCGGTSFGVRRGGAEHVEEWAGRAAPVPVRRLRDDEAARLPGRDESCRRTG